MSQRSLIIFWLLLAATVCLDAVVISWVASEPYPDPMRAAVAFHAAMFGQLSVICIWSAMSNGILNRAAPLFAIALAAILTATLIDTPVTLSDSIPNRLAQFGLHAVLLTAILWLLQRTAFWRRRSGTNRHWQYSVAHLLLTMTLVAVLVTLLRHSPLTQDVGIAAAFICSSVALAVASVVVWSLSWHWFGKLAAVLACALILTLALLIAVSWIDPSNFGRFLATFIGAQYLIQALIVSAWLGLAPILPVPPIGRHDAS
jgi:hypothetical protein